MYSASGKSLCTYKRNWKWCSRNIVSISWIKQLPILPILHINRCLTTEYSETTSHFNATSILTTKSTYRSLSTQRISGGTVYEYEKIINVDANKYGLICLTFLGGSEILLIPQLVEEIRWLRPMYWTSNSLCTAYLCLVLYGVYMSVHGQQHNVTLSVNIA
jgi:hypothetical protein